jgi:TM2 domain-containing membrane protein YozV
VKVKSVFFVIFLFSGTILFGEEMETVRGAGYEVSGMTGNEKITSNLEPRTPNLVLDTQLNTKDPVIAWLISFPAGMLGLHRAYLGTSTTTIILYIVTAGGVFGIVPMIDWILLLQSIQKGDISRFVGNKKFIMWL